MEKRFNEPSLFIVCKRIGVVGDTGSWVLDNLKKLWDAGEFENISIDLIDGSPKTPCEL